jgi:hypothetical protein
MITQFSQAPFYSRLPELARLRAEGRESVLVAMAQRGMRWSYWAFVVASIAAGLFAQPILRILGSRVEFIPLASWLVLMGGLFLERFGAMHLQLYSTTNHVRWHVAAGGGAVIFLASALILVPRLGYPGFIWSSLLGNLLFFSWYCARLSYGALSVPPLLFERKTSAWPFATLIAFTLLAMGISLR